MKDKNKYKDNINIKKLEVSYLWFILQNHWVLANRSQMYMTFGLLVQMFRHWAIDRLKET